jgi:hypothetical protein
MINTTAPTSLDHHIGDGLVLLIGLGPAPKGARHDVVGGVWGIWGLEGHMPQALPSRGLRALCRTSVGRHGHEKFRRRLAPPLKGDSGISLPSVYTCPSRLTKDSLLCGGFGVLSVITSEFDAFRPGRAD